ncbi:hypothetical protein [Arsenicibacter rosenii]|uniref:Uncharacterized protein n=1 Tax=Arsenicibacter rosenii TaxID=1750698 RepID=A0A1S2VPM2_9BACT|nr:hypothetical protein [Arsenicibacter rosenii]OIN60709.1 hypothetical protein BLX24_00930 [Arsenicibacter rosenii]
MNSQHNATLSTRPAAQELKQSIRDMIRLQTNYQLSDELFWEVFNTRVLLNQDVNVDAFIRELQHSSPHGHA